MLSLEMFYCCVLRSQKTGAPPHRGALRECARTNPRRPNTEHRGSSSHSEEFALVPQQRNVSDITKLARIETNSTRCNRAVAAATGRGFKSHQPDVNHE
jgi:hypothetical protein